jgi:hypothetical protein
MSHPHHQIRSVSWSPNRDFKAIEHRFTWQGRRTFKPPCVLTQRQFLAHFLHTGQIATSNICKFTISMQSDCSLQLRPCRCSHFACLENRTSDLPTTLPKSPPHSQNLSLNQCLCHNFVVKVTEHGQK